MTPKSYENCTGLAWAGALGLGALAPMHQAMALLAVPAAASGVGELAWLPVEAGLWWLTGEFAGMAWSGIHEQCNEFDWHWNPVDYFAH